VTKLSADGSTSLYSTVLAGTSQDVALAVTVDPTGNAIVTGLTTSSDFPVSAGVVQPQFTGLQGVYGNVFVTRLDSAGNIIFSTYLGGPGGDQAKAVRTDSAGNILVAGQTNSTDFPTTPGSFQSAPMVQLWNTTPGGFISKLTPDGRTLTFSSYVPAGVAALAVSASGEAYLAGSTGAGFPVTQSAPLPCFGARTDAFVAHLDSEGSLLDATYVGKSGAANGLSFPGDGSILVASDLAFSQIRFGGAGWNAPPCISPDVLNAAAFYSNGSVSPGEFVSLTGFGIGPQVGVTYQPDGQGQAPLELSGVRVLFDGQPAPVIYVQSRQINALAPFELVPGSMTTITVEYGGATFGPVTVPVSFGDPGLFRLQPGVSAQAFAVNEDGTINGPSNPASPGSVIALWDTGFGPISPACAAGGLNPSTAVSLAQGFSVEFLEQTPVLYAGSAPTLLCGVVQINIQVPDHRTAGIQLEPWAVMSSLNSTGTGITTDYWQSFIGSTIFVK
jgi:uncharacterized protein (TIGR03437 family)